MVCVHAPRALSAISLHYAHFPPVADEQVVECLEHTAKRLSDQPVARNAVAVAVVRNAAADTPMEMPIPIDRGYARDVQVTAGHVRLPGRLNLPQFARGFVVFAHGAGSSSTSPRNRYVAGKLNHAGLGTLLFDLLTQEEAEDRRAVFDIDLLAERLAGAVQWLRAQPGAQQLPLGLFGASTGAAAALRAAAEPGADVGAVVSRGGRPDLAGPRLSAVSAPTLLIVGSRDHTVLELNRSAQARLRCENQLVLVPGATHLFEEPHALSAVARLARDWFTDHLRAG